MVILKVLCVLLSAIDYTVASDTHNIMGRGFWGYLEWREIARNLRMSGGDLEVRGGRKRRAIPSPLPQKTPSWKKMRTTEERTDRHDVTLKVMAPMDAASAAEMSEFVRIVQGDPSKQLKHHR